MSHVEKEEKALVPRGDTGTFAIQNSGRLRKFREEMTYSCGQKMTLSKNDFASAVTSELGLKEQVHHAGKSVFRISWVKGALYAKAGGQETPKPTQELEMKW